jgi:hypothetical protein
VGGGIAGLVLAMGGFPMVGYFFLGVSVISAIVVRLKVRDSAEFLHRVGPQKGQPAAANNAAGRGATPRPATIDSQAVKTTEKGGREVTTPSRR